jgi:hypothetical protein
MLAVILAGALVGGCGDSDDEGEAETTSSADDEAAIEEVVDGFYTDGLTKGEDTSCSQLTPEAEEAFAKLYPTKKGTCSEGVAFFANQGNPSNTLYDIQSIEVEGDTATVTLGAVVPIEAELVKSGDEWLISNTGQEG